MALSSLKAKVATLDTRRGSGVAVERIRGSRLHKIRERIGLRDEYTCQICGRVTVQGEVDHRVPLAEGGGNNDQNLWWLCIPCHKKKSEQEGKRRG
jgi:5-methylcytosine-specific restriction protein A